MTRILTGASFVMVIRNWAAKPRVRKAGECIPYGSPSFQWRERSSIDFLDLRSQLGGRVAGGQ
jgi:hypothetical protein